jgi:simple sugar transport system ATP-binding protein
MLKTIRLERITKRFPGVLACDDVSLTIRPGIVHAIVGENGAGKSTLMGILAGLHQPDAGSIYINDARVRFTSPRDAVAKGIGMVYQEFMLVRSLTAVDNIILGFEPTRFSYISRDEALRRIQELMELHGISVPLDQPVGRLPVSQQQQVEILKALYRGADLLILDEPTSVLTPQETQGLFRAIPELIKKGKSVIFISHKLPEVLQIADTITVMRDGRVVGSVDRDAATERQLARMMVGRDIQLDFAPPEATADKAILQVRDLTVIDPRRGTTVVDGVSLAVRAGEIVGIAGVSGNGQNELVEAIVGLRKPASGTIKLRDRDITFTSAGQRRWLGMRYIPQDRAWVGSCRTASLWKNLLMGYQYRQSLANGIFLNEASVRDFARFLVERFSVKAASIDVDAGTLSGGNLQKAIVARELAETPQVLIAEDPTRGIDIGATEFVRGQILEVAKKGGAVLLISGDLQEIMSMSTRVLVMYRGRVVGEKVPSETSEEEFGLLMAGHSSAGTSEGTDSE